MIEKTRIDKWLWAVRIFKSRTIASDACKSSKVFINHIPVKPSQWITKDMIIEVRKQGFKFQFKVLELIEKRVAASIAAKCYQDLTPKEELNKYQSWFDTNPEIRPKGSGRPTKKDRREIDDNKSILFDWTE